MNDYYTKYYPKENKIERSEIEELVIKLEIEDYDE